MKKECIITYPSLGEMTDISLGIFYHQDKPHDIFKKDEFTVDDIKSRLLSATREPLFEGLCFTLGYDTATSKKDILTAVRKLYKDKLGFRMPKTVENWIKGISEPSLDSGRENHYGLCMALGLDISQTCEFFEKYFLSVPFNFKDQTDASFLYGISHNKTYKEIMYFATLDIPKLTEANDVTDTVNIGNNILKIVNDDDFIDYLKQHCFTSKVQYLAAKDKTKKLIRKFYHGNISDVHYRVVGFHYYDKLLSTSPEVEMLPKRYTENLPSPTTFSDIYESTDKPVSYESLRKAYIIMFFYDFFRGYLYSDEIKDSEIAQRFDEFYIELSDELISCGMTPLYARHPFDEIIMLSASSRHPIDTLHAINDWMYYQMSDETES